MPSQILILNQPRSGSHLLGRMLGEQSNLNHLRHPLSSGRGPQLEWLRSESFSGEMSESTCSEFDDEMTKGIKAWQEALAEAEKTGQVLMVHSETYHPGSPDRIFEYMNVTMARTPSPGVGENFTVVPDSLLLHPGTVPILTIRNPRLVVPSAYRVLQKMGFLHGGGRNNYLIVTCHIWSRLLYDFYVSNGADPIVVDADDYMTSGHFVRHLCSQAGLDPAQAYLSWPMPTQEERAEIHPMYYASQSTLIESSGIQPSKAAKNVDLEAEEKGWETEFGEDLPLLKEMVELAMPHYTYLHERRLKI